jgi:hypothetical protein
MRNKISRNSVWALQQCNKIHQKYFRDKGFRPYNQESDYIDGIDITCGLDLEEIQAIPLCVVAAQDYRYYILAQVIDYFILYSVENPLLSGDIPVKSKWKNVYNNWLKKLGMKKIRTMAQQAVSEHINVIQEWQTNTVGKVTPKTVLYQTIEKYAIKMTHHKLRMNPEYNGFYFLATTEFIEQIVPQMKPNSKDESSNNVKLRWNNIPGENADELNEKANYTLFDLYVWQEDQSELKKINNEYLIKLKKIRMEAKAKPEKQWIMGYSGPRQYGQMKVIPKQTMNPKEEIPKQSIKTKEEIPKQSIKTKKEIPKQSIKKDYIDIETTITDDSSVTTPTTTSLNTVSFMETPFESDITEMTPPLPSVQGATKKPEKLRRMTVDTDILCDDGTVIPKTPPGYEYATRGNYSVCDAMNRLYVTTEEGEFPIAVKKNQKDLVTYYNDEWIPIEVDIDTDKFTLI